MITLEKLTSNTMDIFKKLYDRNFLNENYDKDFFSLYNNQNFVIKFLFRKFLKLIRYNDEVIGYIWYDTPLESTIRIWSLYIENDYMGFIDENTLKAFNTSILSYEAIDNPRNTKILTKLGFKRIRPTILMELNLNKYNRYKDINEIKLKLQLENSYVNKIYNSIFNTNYISSKYNNKKFIIGKDEALRCKIQNNIFSTWNREPLKIEDIYSDISQEYYLKDLSLFGMINDKFVGYGQVIYNRNMYTVVNFGIINEFRGFGIGKLLLHDLIVSSKSKGFNKLYIRVDEDNIAAQKLYKWAGFVDKCTISRWDRGYKNY
ncbi:GNAT family N-acetyltransferase [Clostridium septicum]|uniref:GNAT family N-acetyltransferase n=1 Tax=Clostridium septicum TaxID=1504 RepID=UPI0032168023